MHIFYDTEKKPHADFDVKGKEARHGNKTSNMVLIFFAEKKIRNMLGDVD